MLKKIMWIFSKKNRCKKSAIEMPEWEELKKRHGEQAWQLIDSSCINNLAVDKEIKFSGFVRKRGNLK
jgi:hypothetical protein